MPVVDVEDVELPSTTTIMVVSSAVRDRELDIDVCYLCIASRL
jgi:hypothetical protein